MWTQPAVQALSDLKRSTVQNIKLLIVYLFTANKQTMKLRRTTHDQFFKPSLAVYIRFGLSSLHRNVRLFFF